MEKECHFTFAAGIVLLFFHFDSSCIFISLRDGRESERTQFVFFSFNLLRCILKEWHIMVCCETRFQNKINIICLNTEIKSKMKWALKCVCIAAANILSHFRTVCAACTMRKLVNTMHASYTYVPNHTQSIMISASYRRCEHAKWMQIKKGRETLLKYILYENPINLFRPTYSVWLKISHLWFQFAFTFVSDWKRLWTVMLMLLEPFKTPRVFDLIPFRLKRIKYHWNVQKWPKIQICCCSLHTK